MALRIKKLEEKKTILQNETTELGAQLQDKIECRCVMEKTYEAMTKRSEVMLAESDHHDPSLVTI